MLDIIIQVILAILLLLIMGFLAYSIYDNEYIKSIRYAWIGNLMVPLAFTNLI